MQNDINNGETLRFGRYQVLHLLGEGAMGRVYLSEDPILKRQVAVKVISTDKHIDPQILSGYLVRFTVEAQACAKLNHPSVVSIYDAGETDGAPWIAFEYVDGERLDQLIKRKRQLPFDAAARIAGDVAAAMRHAHGLNIFHRDIKPANILIDDKTGIAKLADFGVVKAPFTTITQDGVAVGSPGYMSPEQIDNLAVDARSDIFSFGITLYEMITGKHPFLRDTVQSTLYATMSCNFTPVRKLREDAPEKLVKIIEKSLIADRNLRIIDADELCSMIAGYLENGGRKTGAIELRKTTRNLAAQARYVCVAIIREIRRTLKATMPLLRKISAATTPVVNKFLGGAVTFYKKKIAPPIKNISDKVYAKLEKHFTKKQITIAAASVAAIIATAVIVTLIVTISDRQNNRESELIAAAREKGYDLENVEALADTVRSYLDKCDAKNARRLAGILAADNDKNTALQGALFKAMADYCAENFESARHAFEIVQQFDDGNSAIRGEHAFLIKHLEKWMPQGKLPDPLAALCAEQLRLHESPQIQEWTGDRHYWIRWNAVTIMRQGGETVDLVPVYILDLNHSGSASTKIRAAEKLGELKDRRAIPALTAARNDRRHPASATARKVLRERFSVR